MFYDYIHIWLHLQYIYLIESIPIYMCVFIPNIYIHIHTHIIYICIYILHTYTHTYIYIHMYRYSQYLLEWSVQDVTEPRAPRGCFCYKESRFAWLCRHQYGKNQQNRMNNGLTWKSISKNEDLMRFSMELIEWMIVVIVLH
jgi:hypothetical protein